MNINNLNEINETLIILGKESELINWQPNTNLYDLYFLFLFKTRELNHHCYINPLIIDISYSSLEDYLVDEILDQIETCIIFGVKTIIIPIKLVFGEKKSKHANILIYRHDKHVIEHYEPHGSRFVGSLENFQEKINNQILIFRDNLFDHLKSVFNEEARIQVIESHIVCPINMGGFQGLVELYGNLTDTEKKKGYCLAWSLFMAYFVLRYPEFSTFDLFKNILRIILKINNNDKKKLGPYLTNILRSFINKINNALIKFLSALYNEQMTLEKINNRINTIIIDILPIIDEEKYYMNEIRRKGSLNSENGLSPIIKEEFLDDKDLNKIDNLIRQKIEASELALAKSKLKHVSPFSRRQTQKIRSAELSLAKSKLKHVSPFSRRKTQKVRSAELSLAKSKLKPVSPFSRRQTQKVNKSELSLAKSKLKQVSSSKKKNNKSQDF
jgi:hypothetical protein